MRKLIFFIVILFIISCKKISENNTNEKITIYGDSVITMNQPDKPIDELKDLAINKGDTNAYYQLYIAYLDYPHGDFFQIAEEMALKQNYTRAYYDAYYQLLKEPNLDNIDNSFYSLDEKTRIKALKYIEIAAGNNYKQAIDDLKRINCEKMNRTDTIINQKIAITKKTTTP